VGNDWPSTISGSPNSMKSMNFFIRYYLSDPLLSTQNDTNHCHQRLAKDSARRDYFCLFANTNSGCFNILPSMQTIKRLSIIVPVYNEATTILTILEQIEKVELLNKIQKEIVIVN